jgi:dihydrodipicolinate synthase/N-acetylneuraminate lyase
LIWETLTEQQRDDAISHAAYHLSISGEGKVAQEATALVIKRFIEWGMDGLFLPQGTWRFASMTEDELPELAQQLHSYWGGFPSGSPPPLHDG